MHQHMTSHIPSLSSSLCSLFLLWITDDPDVRRAHRAVQDAAGRDQQPIRRPGLWTNVSCSTCLKLVRLYSIVLLMFHVFFLNVWSFSCSLNSWYLPPAERRENAHTQKHRQPLWAVSGTMRKKYMLLINLLKVFSVMRILNMSVHRTRGVRQLGQLLQLTLRVWGLCLRVFMCHCMSLSPVFL